MTISIRLFAMLRETVGAGELPLELPAGATVSRAVESLVAKHPELGALVKRSACTVNLSRVSADTTLNEGDELALLPPVSGG